MLMVGFKGSVDGIKNGPTMLVELCHVCLLLSGWHTSAINHIPPGQPMASELHGNTWTRTLFNAEVVHRDEVDRIVEHALH